MSNILAQHIAHNENRNRATHSRISLMVFCSVDVCLLTHTVWIIRVHFLGVRHPVACFLKALVGVIGQVQELTTFDTHMCVGNTRPSTTSLSKISPNNFGSLRRLTKVKIPWGPFTEGPLLPAPQAAWAGVIIPYCSALSCCPLHGGLLGISSAWSPSSPAVSSSIM